MNDISTQVTPMALLQSAQEKGATIEQMQQLLDLQDRWEAREARKAYVEAMSLLRERMPTIARTRTGHNSKYSGLAETIEEIQPLLSEFGLSHQWKTTQTNGQIGVECTITHKLGHSESTSLSAEPDKTGGKNSIQAIGSTVAYLERYTLYAILGLASREMDDDGKGTTDTTEYVNGNQIANIETLIEEVGADVYRMLAFCNAATVDKIPAAKYNELVKRLEEKRRK